MPLASKRIFFDIETVANPEAIKLMPEPSPAKNLKDPEKINADIAEKKADQIAMAALDPDYGKVISIAWADSYLESVQPLVFTCETEDLEIATIRKFWDSVRFCDGRMVGYNILGFDIPFLLRRSMALGIDLPYGMFLNLAKFRNEPVTDLMGILYNWGPAKSLKQVAKLYHLKNEAEGVSGADVSSMKPEDIARYNISDVKLTQQLFVRMNGRYFNL
jgi:hypothetical protein